MGRSTCIFGFYEVGKKRVKNWRILLLLFYTYSTGVRETQNNEEANILFSHIHIYDELFNLIVLQ